MFDMKTFDPEVFRTSEDNRRLSTEYGTLALSMTDAGLWRIDGYGSNRKGIEYYHYVGAGKTWGRFRSDGYPLDINVRFIDTLNAVVSLRAKELLIR